jgi:DNA-binding MarR family transcriptional regulator
MAANPPLDNSRYKEYPGEVAGKIEDQALAALQRTAERFQQEIADALKPAGLSPAQYCVLEILSLAGSEGLPCGEVGNRMINRDPDMTRLLDRMEARGWVTRARRQEDRRVVTACITGGGHRLFRQVEDNVADLLRLQFAALTRAELRSLIAMLDRLRATE